MITEGGTMMLLTEEMKSRYDAIGYKKDGVVKTIHENGSTGMKGSYDTVQDFMDDAESKSIKGIVVESVNG